MLAHFGARSVGANHAIAITFVLGIALIATAMAILVRRIILTYFAKRGGNQDPGRTTIATVVLGAILGVPVSFASVGVTVLLVLYPALPASKLVGSDIAHAVPLALIAGFGHWLTGSVNLLLLLSLLTSSIPGIIIGSLVSTRMPDTVLRPILASRWCWLAAGSSSKIASAEKRSAHFSARPPQRHPRFASGVRGA
jgi:hypothetical protein